VHTAVVLGAKLLGNVREQAKIDVVGDEGGERGETSAKGVQDLEQGIEGVLGVF
jgi:formaldehyde-activating enzyme involved in methanogenesis